MRLVMRKMKYMLAHSHGIVPGRESEGPICKRRAERHQRAFCECAWRRHTLYYRGMYYLFGEVKKGKTWLVPGQQWEDYRVPAGGVSCYSSSDLETLGNI